MERQLVRGKPLPQIQPWSPRTTGEAALSTGHHPGDGSLSARHGGRLGRVAGGGLRSPPARLRPLSNLPGSSSASPRGLPAAKDPVLVHRQMGRGGRVAGGAGGALPGKDSVIHSGGGIRLSLARRYATEEGTGMGARNGNAPLLLKEAPPPPPKTEPIETMPTPQQVGS